MSAIHKIDGKSHLRSPFLADIHLVQAEIRTVETDPSDFAKDFVTEHSCSGAAAMPVNRAKAPMSAQALAALKSAKA